MRIIYEGEEIPKGVYERWTWELERDPNYETLDVTRFEECDECNGEGYYYTETRKFECPYCLGTGEIGVGDAIGLKRDYYDQLVERAKQRNLIKKRYGGYVGHIANYWNISGSS